MNIPKALKRLRLASAPFPAIECGFPCDSGNAVSGSLTSAIELRLPTVASKVRVRFRATYLNSTNINDPVPETPTAAAVALKISIRRLVAVFVVTALAGDNVTLTVTNPDGTPANLQANEFAPGAGYKFTVTLPGRNYNLIHAIKDVASNTATQIVVNSTYAGGTQVPQVGDEILVYGPDEYIFGTAGATVNVAAGAEIEASSFVASAGATRTVGNKGPARNYGPMLVAYADAGVGNYLPTYAAKASVGGAFPGANRLDGGAYALATIANGTNVLAFSSIIAEPIGDVTCSAVAGEIGDSILAGKNGQQDPHYSAAPMRAIARTLGRTVVKAVSGMKAARIAAAAGTWAQDFVNQGVQVVFINAGTNDARLGDTSANILGYLTQITAACKAVGLKTVWVPLTPQTTSTDNWVTTANQAAATGQAARLAVNAAIDASPGTYGFDAIWDWRPYIETGGVWIPGRNSTSDGATSLHLSETGHQVAGTGVDIGPVLSMINP